MYDCGKVSTNLNYAINLESLGFHSFHTMYGFKLMGHFLHCHKQSYGQAPCDIMIAPVNWAVVTSRIHTPCLEELKPAPLTTNVQVDGASSKKISFATVLDGVIEDNEKREILQKIVVQLLSEVIGGAGRTIDRSISIISYLIRYALDTARYVHRGVRLRFPYEHGTAGQVS